MHADAGHELLDRFELELGLPNSRRGGRDCNDDEQQRRDKVDPLTPLILSHCARDTMRAYAV